MDTMGRHVHRTDERLSAALAAFGKVARKGIQEATNLGDLYTADVFTAVSR